MSTTKHSPGPWKVDRETEQIESENYVLGLVYGCSHDDSPDCKANADLIEAAPELLAHLEKIITELAPMYNFDVYQAPAYVKEANDLLIKLRG